MRQDLSNMKVFEIILHLVYHVTSHKIKRESNFMDMLTLESTPVIVKLSIVDILCIFPFFQ